tara:strand:- start:399 stop:563 length:165 start_codon:yes stop_codon:yes gene_type:complete
MVEPIYRLEIESLLKELKQVFKPTDYNHKNTIEEIMFKEGEQKVLRFIERKLGR